MSLTQQTGGEILNTQLLKSYRVKLGFTQKNIAKLLQIDVTTYSKKENGVIEFKASEISILKVILNLTPMDIDEIFFNHNVEINSTKVEAV